MSVQKRKRRVKRRAPNDAEILTFQEWIKLRRFSKATGRRVLNAGYPFIKLSARLIGIRRSDAFLSTDDLCA
jgi:hypothetical protein